MKRVSATQARRDWFRLLDEVLEGETVMIERKGRRIFIQSGEQPDAQAAVPDYGSLLEAPEVNRADEWGWEWPGPEGEIVVRESAGSESDPESAP